MVIKQKGDNAKLIQDITGKSYKAAGYARLSITENNDGESSSIVNQKECIKDYAKKAGIEIYDYYVDDGYSGGNFERPAFKRLINDIECGIINCVITKDTSRLGRDFIGTGAYIYKYFPENDVRYISILDEFDTEEPRSNDDMIPLKTVINDMFLKETSRKIISVRHNLMEQGLFVGSTVPYGYARSKDDNRKLVVDEYAANIVKRIFKMKINGESPNMIARSLTNEGILPPSVYNNKKIKKTFTTNLWKGSAINNIITNEVYIGTLIQGKYKRVSLKSKKKRLLPKNMWIIKKNNHEPIINKKTFELANKKLAESIKLDIRHVKYDYLLKGLVFCEDCGKAMLVRRCKSKSKKSKNSIYAVYCCRTYATYRSNVCSMHYYREEALNKLVLDETRKILIKYSDNKELSKAYDLALQDRDLLNNYQTELDQYYVKLKNVDKAISDLYKDKMSGIINTEEFVNIKKDLSNEKLILSDKISDLNGMLSDDKSDINDEKTKKKIINNFLKVKNPDSNLLREIIKKITIDKNKKVRIYFNFNINGELNND